MNEQLEALLESLESLAGQAEEFQEAILEIEDEPRFTYKLAELGQVKDRLDTVVGLLRDASMIILNRIKTDRVDEGFIGLPDGKVLEMGTGGGGRKGWEHDRLKSVVAEKVLERHIDPDTGAIEAPFSVIMAEVLDIIGPSYWKVGELKRLGIDPDHYSTQGEAKFSVKIHDNT